MTEITKAERPDDPKQVLADDSMSADEKEAFLKDWQLDLVEGLRATEENMASAGGQGPALAEQLAAVNSALSELTGSKTDLD